MLIWFVCSVRVRVSERVNGSISMLAIDLLTKIWQRNSPSLHHPVFVTTRTEQPESSWSSSIRLNQCMPVVKVHDHACSGYSPVSEWVLNDHAHSSTRLITQSHTHFQACRRKRSVNKRVNKRMLRRRTFSVENLFGKKRPKEKDTFKVNINLDGCDHCNEHHHHLPWRRWGTSVDDVVGCLLLLKLLTMICTCKTN